MQISQDIFYTNPSQTVVIASDIEADNRIVTITAKNVILLAQGSIFARELNVTCSDKFITIGTVDANRQNIDASEAFIAGRSTTVESEFFVRAYEYPCFELERAQQEIVRILDRHLLTPNLPNCRLEALELYPKRFY